MLSHKSPNKSRILTFIHLQNTFTFLYTLVPECITSVKGGISILEASGRFKETFEGNIYVKVVDVKATRLPTF